RVLPAGSGEEAVHHGAPGREGQARRGRRDVPDVLDRDADVQVAEGRLDRADDQRRIVLCFRYELERRRADPPAVNITTHSPKVEAEAGDPEKVSTHGVATNVPEAPRDAEVVAGG